MSIGLGAIFCVLRQLFEAPARALRRCSGAFEHLRLQRVALVRAEMAQQRLQVRRQFEELGVR